MPPFSWASDPLVVIKDFEARHKSPSAGALFMWAISTTESLHCLDDIDRIYNTLHVSAGNHRADVIDVAHARWATSSCITVLDLCAAGLGHSFCSNTTPRELDLGCFDANRASKRRLVWQVAIPQLALQWVTNVLGDGDYREIKAARDSLIHSRLRRHFRMSLGGPPQRLKLEVQSKQLEVRHIVQVVRNVATTHVSKFLDLLPAL